MNRLNALAFALLLLLSSLSGCIGDLDASNDSESDSENPSQDGSENNSETKSQMTDPSDMLRKRFHCRSDNDADKVPMKFQMTIRMVV